MWLFFLCSKVTTLINVKPNGRKENNMIYKNKSGYETKKKTKNHRDLPSKKSKKKGGE